MIGEKTKKCHDYLAWRDHSGILNITECMFFAPQSGFCHCEHGPNNMKPCIYIETDGYPPRERQK